MFALAAFVLWGVLPLYWKLLKHFPADFILSHRIVWSAIFLAAWVFLRGDWRQVTRQFISRETLVRLIPSTLLIGSNWYLYIWAVNSGFVLETSFGYFLNPLINVILGTLFLGERLSRWQKAAVALVVLAIANLLISHGRLPWIALALALSFGLYGLMKKMTKSDSLTSLTNETWLLIVPAFVALLVSPVSPAAIPAGSWALLVGGGILTALPLYFFGRAAKHLSLSTIGIFQYIAPSMQFFLAVFVFREPFLLPTLVSFVLIWTALAIYTWDSFRVLRASRPNAR